MSVQTRIRAFLERPRVVNAILGVILFNAIILGLETSQRIMAVAGGLLKALDTICLAIFVIEIFLKLIAYRSRFFRQGWNIFDFLIVMISLAPGSEGLSVLRALRILRLLRVAEKASTWRSRSGGDQVPKLCSVATWPGC